MGFASPTIKTISPMKGSFERKPLLLEKIGQLAGGIMAGYRIELVMPECFSCGNCIMVCPDFWLVNCIYVCEDGRKLI